MTRRGHVIVIIATALALGGCGSSGHSSATPTTHGTSPLCDTTASCQTMYEHGGATAAQAACMARVFRPPVVPGVNDSAPFAAQNCVGTMKRTLAIVHAAAAWEVAQHETTTT